MSDLKVLLTEGEVAELFGISKSLLQKHRHQRKGLPYVKFGRLVRYRRDDVLVHMAQLRIGGDDHV